jgi:hypothetical protein
MHVEIFSWYLGIPVSRQSRKTIKSNKKNSMLMDQIKKKIKEQKKG